MLPIHRVIFKAMGSACEVVLAAKSETEAKHQAQFAIDEVLRIEKKYSRYADPSVITAINQLAGKEAYACDDETWALFEFASELYDKSDGLFDITSGVLRRAWNFSKPELPAQEHLHALTELIGWHQVELHSKKIFLPVQGMEIDIGGFGKEYAADCAARQLSQVGVQHGYVNLAGDMRFLGPKPNGEPWSIGIQDPRQREEIIATLPMSVGGLATSGDYERYFELQGQRYCHVLNPHTGYPVTHWRTISVNAPMAVLAGCVSTMAMLKEENALSFLESTGFDYFAVDHQGGIHMQSVKSGLSKD